VRTSMVLGALPIKPLEGSRSRLRRMRAKGWTRSNGYRISASFGPSSVGLNTEQSTRAVARPASLSHQSGVEVERFVILSTFGVSLVQVLLEDCVMCELLANLH